ncbi:hypothetical protein E2C01_047940 [Portunus trituberculatus]|uniref:Uncharacterized protein n=1 Tax=Portunus trituberculatus TaxID=210409 RepID=A0A5B7G9V3_PORTR|nr:hypothetical protein [Portunus trituberculatus]
MNGCKMALPDWLLFVMSSLVDRMSSWGGGGCVMDFARIVELLSVFETVNQTCETSLPLHMEATVLS